MTSFAVRLEPARDPRLAALLALGHGTAAVLPWIAQCPAPLAAAASAVALAGLAASLARLPGPHGRLAALAADAHACHARLAGSGVWQPAAFTRRSRSYAGLVVVEVAVTGRRYGWLLSRRSLPPESFRRLKALIRLAC